jgi:hypothetical protein
MVSDSARERIKAIVDELVQMTGLLSKKEEGVR